jgi:hypothetical protein
MEIEQESIGHTLLPINSSNSQLSLFLNDCVLARQMKETEEYWVPGLVLCVPSPFNVPANLYTIQIFDPTARKVGIERVEEEI